MASATPHRILLSTNEIDGSERPIDNAVVLTAAVTPGDLCTFSTGGKITPNASAADVDAAIIVAVENPYLNPATNTSAAIDTDYAVGAVAYFMYPQRGDVCYMWLEDEGNVAKGAALESDGAGALQAYSSGRIVAFAEEAKDNTGGSGSIRIKARIA
jgi:hypothetical protein